MTIKQDLCSSLKDIKSFIKFKMLKFKVPMNFLGTVGFSLRRRLSWRRHVIVKPIFLNLSELHCKLIFRHEQSVICFVHMLNRLKTK
jgi:hypothetical protein